MHEVADLDEVANFTVLVWDRGLEGRHQHAGHHTCGPADQPENLRCRPFSRFCIDDALTTH